MAYNQTPTDYAILSNYFGMPKSMNPIPGAAGPTGISQHFGGAGGSVPIGMPTSNLMSGSPQPGIGGTGGKF